jgi:hypothetical protein
MFFYCRVGWNYWSITMRIGTISPSRAFAPTSALVPFGNKEEMP